MLRIAMERNIPFVFLSTGAVFSNQKEFHEESIPSPQCIYGYTKKAAEDIALLYEKTILIRTGWLFGGNQKTHYKFVEHVIHQLLMKK
jgi:dTDP-4-dehydrorhamnose reductase